MRSHRSSLPVVAAAASVLMLAACGSQVSPEEFRAANFGAPGSGAGPNSGAYAGANTGADAGVPSGDLGASGGAVGGEAGAPSGGGAAGGGAGGTSGGGSAVGTGENAAAGTTRAGDCAGLKNQTGITDKEITIANASRTEITTSNWLIWPS